MKLEALGWDPALQYHLDELAGALGLDHNELIGARVVRADGPICRLLGAAGELTATVPAARQRGAPGERPVVGDWCAVAPLAGDTPSYVVHALLPRRGCLSRKAAGRAMAVQVVAANIDTVLVVVGLDGDFNPRRIERYLTLATAGDASAVVVLNKADTCAEWPGAWSWPSGWPMSLCWR